MSVITYPVMRAYRLPDLRPIGWTCRSGRHTQGSRDEAEKCCHPDWERRRIEIRSLTGLGVMDHWKWVPRRARR